MSPRYVSHEGVWHPQKERVALKNLSGKEKVVDGEKIANGEEYIYKGADRAALFELFKEKVETFGQDFRKNTEFLQAVRNMGFSGKGGVDEYLEFVGYDKERIDKEFKDKASVVNKNELPKRVKMIETLGGGRDTAGEAPPKYGGFGDQPKD